jgi:hypothetical protein
VTVTRKTAASTAVSRSRRGSGSSCGAIAATLGAWPERVVGREEYVRVRRAA